MDRARINEGIRRMRFEDLLDRCEHGELGQESAAELLGISDRTFRRWRDRLHEEGPAGLADRRLRPSGRRAAQAEIERMLGLYRAHYGEFTVKHFHEQLVKRHNYKLGYTVTKVWLQRSGLVQPDLGHRVTQLVVVPLHQLLVEVLHRELAVVRPV